MLLMLLFRASPIEALNFGAVKIVCSVLDLDTARGGDVIFAIGSILQRNQEAKNNPSPEAVNRAPQTSFFNIHTTNKIKQATNKSEKIN
jgi:hypothetical protein